MNKSIKHIRKNNIYDNILYVSLYNRVFAIKPNTQSVQ